MKKLALLLILVLALMAATPALAYVERFFVTQNGEDVTELDLGTFVRTGELTDANRQVITLTNRFSEELQLMLGYTDVVITDLEGNVLNGATPYITLAANESKDVVMTPHQGGTFPTTWSVSAVGHPTTHEIHVTATAYEPMTAYFGAPAITITSVQGKTPSQKTSQIGYAGNLPGKATLTVSSNLTLVSPNDGILSFPATIKEYTETPDSAETTLNFKLTAKENLTAGYYNESVTVTFTLANSDTPSTMTIPVTVVIKPAYSELTLDRSEVVFDPITEGDSLPTLETINIKNTGTVECPIVHQENNDYFTFSIVGASSLSAGESKRASVRPNAEKINKPGVYETEITITGDGKEHVVKAKLEVKAAPKPDLKIYPENRTLPFGDVYPDQINDSINQLDLMLENVGDAAAKLTYSFDNNKFAFVNEPADALPAGETLDLLVKPATTQLGDHTGILTISDGENTYAVDLSVTIVEKPFPLTVSPQEIDFGSVAEGDELPQGEYITLTNNSDEAIQLTVSNTNDNAFFVARTSETITLDAGEEYRCFAEPVADQAGVYSGYAVFTVEGFEDEEIAVPLDFEVTANTAQNPALLISPLELDFGTLTADEINLTMNQMATSIMNFSGNTISLTASLDSNKFAFVGPIPTQVDPLGADYLRVKPATTQPGAHTGILTISDGENTYTVDLSVTIVANPASYPKTGDVANPALWAGLMAAAALVMPKRKRK